MFFRSRKQEIKKRQQEIEELREKQFQRMKSFLAKKKNGGVTEEEEKLFRIEQESNEQRMNQLQKDTRTRRKKDHGMDTSVFVQVGSIVAICLFMIGCASTEAQRQNHQISINKNEQIHQILQQNMDNMLSSILLPHVIQQARHLAVTQMWLGVPEDPVPMTNDHGEQDAILEKARAEAEAKNAANGILEGLWQNVTDQWPWAGSVGVLITSLFGVYGLYKKYKGSFRIVVNGVQDVIESGKQHGVVSPDFIKETIEAASIAAKKKDEFEKLVSDAKSEYKRILKQINKLKKTPVNGENAGDDA